MRFVGVDLGAKRIGLAVSDLTATIARPWRAIAAGDSPAASAVALAAVLSAPSEDGDIDPGALAGIVVGVPRRLNGEPTHLTHAALDVARRLGELTGLAVHLQDERLTSHEADARLAVNERDWRRRKVRLDAAAAAVILQDYLDDRSARPAAPA